MAQIPMAYIWLLDYWFDLLTMGIQNCSLFKELLLSSNINNIVADSKTHLFSAIQWDVDVATNAHVMAKNVCKELWCRPDI